MNTTTETTAAAAQEAKAKILTVADDMQPRRCFYPTPDKSAIEQAMEFIAAESQRLSDFNDYPFAAPGLSTDDEGETVLSEEIYGGNIGVMVGRLTKVANKAKGTDGGVKCIYMAPIPNFPDTLAGDSTFNDWALGILEKEASHVAVRPLRDAENVLAVVDQMPATVDAYLTASRGQGASLLVAFNELYKAIKTTMSKASKVWEKQNPRLVKSELRRCFESAAYAREYYVSLEDWTNPKTNASESLFVYALRMVTPVAEKRGFDSTIFKRWIDTRDLKPLEIESEEDEDADFDLDALASSMLDATAPTDSKPAADAEPADPAEDLPIG